LVIKLQSNVWECYYKDLVWACSHNCELLSYEKIPTEVNIFKRRIKEAIQIKLTKPALNRDNGYELAAIYKAVA